MVQFRHHSYSLSYCVSALGKEAPADVTDSERSSLRERKAESGRNSAKA